MDAAPLLPLLVIAGPTGSGKSCLAIELARRFGAEIVNCDSLQLYKGFDIGTAKTPRGEQGNVPHHLFDVLQAQEGYSAGEYARQAREAIRTISARRSLPVIVGGTGFYLRALLDGLPPLPERDERLRSKLINRETKRPGSLHRILSRVDPAAAFRMHPRDVQKLVRALEIRLLTRQAVPPTASARPLTGYRAIKIGLNPAREALNQHLDARTEAMFSGGLVDEVRRLLKTGATGQEKPFEALGYKQALRHIQGEMTLEEAIRSTQIETRQYAKRQGTWFRREPGIFWIQGFGDDPTSLATAIAHVETLLGER